MVVIIMKKSLLFILSVICFLILLKSPPESQPVDSDVITWENIMLDIRDMSNSETAEKRREVAEDVMHKLSYADVEMLMKYRISRILSYVNNHPDSDVSKEILSDVKHIFDKNTSCDKEYFFAVCRKIYDDNPEIFGNEKAENSRRFGIRNIDGVFISKILCDRLSSRYAASPDGAVWLYGENFVAAYSNKETPDFLILSPKGDSVHSFENKLTSKYFFERKNSVVFSDDDAIGDFSIVKVYDENLPDNFIQCERYACTGKIVFVDFASFSLSESRCEGRRNR